MKNLKWWLLTISKNEGEIYNFSSKQKLRELITSWPAPQEILNRMLQAKMNEQTKNKTLESTQRNGNHQKVTT